jgi:putative membrane protein
MGGSVTRRPYSLVGVLVVAGGTLTPAACGAGSTGRDAATTSSTSASVSAADRGWLTETHQSGLANIQYGRLAQRKGVTAAVREAGRTLASDNDAFDKRVVRVAKKLDVKLPRSPGAERLAVARRLDNESGSRFDRDFTATLAEEHRRALARAEEQVRGGSSPEVTGLARAAVPTLRRHLDMLRRASPVG